MKIRTERELELWLRGWFERRALIEYPNITDAKTDAGELGPGEDFGTPMIQVATGYNGPAMQIGEPTLAKFDCEEVRLADLARDLMSDLIEV